MPLLQEYSTMTTFRPISMDSYNSVFDSINESFDYMPNNKELFVLIFAGSELTEK